VPSPTPSTSQAVREHLFFLNPTGMHLSKKEKLMNEIHRLLGMHGTKEDLLRILQQAIEKMSPEQKAEARATLRRKLGLK
jgi:hypothetical protein